MKTASMRYTWNSRRKKWQIVIGIAIAVLVVALLQGKEEPIDFSTEVKPIINKHCISCHGGVKKNSGFSLLFEEEAFAVAESGSAAIIPGDAEHSEFIRRLTADDPEERMPYDAPPLSKKEIKVLTRWVEEGAKWGEHWAYSLPKKVAVPRFRFGLASLFSFTGNSSMYSDIDYFIQEKHREQSLSFSGPADRATLLRRVSLDLTGLPPSPEQVAAFVNDDRQDAYERRVDSLLGSPRFGERWASWWLDIARYADTKGYEKDASRQIWAYRDWVIKAFNSDKPFNTFTVEQLAGDLLPNATKDQLIATAFHRNTMVNDEGGTDDEEFRVAATIDRVNTTYQAWLSTTFECVQCHSHTYDPIKFEEYYKSLAFFNNTRDEDTPGDHPTFRFYNREDSLQVAEVKQWVAQHASAEAVASTDLFLHALEPKIHAHACDQLINGALVDTKWLGIRNGGSARLPAIVLNGKDRCYLNYATGSTGGVMEIRADSPDGPVLANITLPATSGTETIAIPIVPLDGQHDLFLQFRNSSIPADRPVCLVEWMAFRKSLPGNGEPDYPKMQQTFLELVNKHTPSVPILVENPQDMRRETHVFERGNWLVKGEVVEPAVPQFLQDFPKDAPQNRLGFAQWLVSEDNPLTARTLVNRVWAQLFGRGIVEPLGDMGSQSDPPTHPELLDWLALQFMHEMNWSVKRLLRELVLSTTYRQSSALEGESAEKDPSNIYYARGPRFRLSAEQIRDQALAVSNLLSTKMYGPSVMPYQPDGVWMTVYSGERWATSEGEDQYRRGLYTFIKRTSPYPSYVTFDASSREVCLVDRIRTNTPLQALATLNDPVYQEAALHLAKRMEAKGKGKPTDAIQAGYLSVMQRPLASDKLTALERLFRETLAHYRQQPIEAAKLLGTSASGAAQKDAATAAYTVVASALLNLDEFLTKS
ncbi:DUF1553 domain-containing protein [Parapedobacter pyrenivorans]|uniref:DUF1553 domain-containing protein n=1 Tax=Parapedobacter pyrenivorans TaxID=1305674 RepID=UPI00333E53B5